MPMKVILIGGTPGTGKTEIASNVAKELKAKLISVSDLAREYDCIDEHDLERDTDVINEDCIVEALIDVLDNLEGRVVMEGHYIDLVPSEFVTDVFILRTHPETLRARLKERAYSNEKVDENVEAEVIGVCQMDALDSFGEEIVKEIDTTSLTPEETVEMILQSRGLKNGVSTRIDWMELLESEGHLDDYINN